MTSFSWLHLTDLHIGMREQDSLLPALKDSFFKDLQGLHDSCGPWDLVLFTGDLTNVGSGGEFQKLDGFLEKLWEHLEKLGSKPKLLAVPGNHDLVRPLDEKAAAVKVLRNWTADPEIRSDFWIEKESSYLQVVGSAFKNYVDWWEKQPFKPPTQPGLLPGDFSAVIEKDGLSLGIIGLNSTFLQLTKGNYEGKLALSARQFQAVCGGDGPEWARKRTACLLLTHHPPEWLTQDSRDELLSEIVRDDLFAMHLFGHMHEARDRAAAEGGGPTRRTSQGPSVFGLEYFGEKGDERARSHGYAIGKIEIKGDEGYFVCWPRKAYRPGQEWKFAANGENFHLVEDRHTRPEIIRLLNSSAVPSSDDRLRPSPLPPNVERPFPRQWAVLVGVNDYQYFTRLQYCRQDVIELARAFRESLGFQQVFEFHEKSEFLAERDEILQKLADLRDEVKPDDLFVFYFSGHGMNVDGKDYLLPIKARPRDVKHFGIAVESVVEILSSSGCKNTAMFIDACRGAPIKGAKGSGSLGEESQEVASNAGIVAFFSCDPRDQSYEIEPLKHGSFTYCILRAIQDGAVTTVAELDGYLKKEVPQLNVKHQKPAQQPYAVTGGKSDLKIFFNPHRAARSQHDFGPLIDCLNELSLQGKILDEDLDKVVEFFSQVQDKKQLDELDNRKLSAIRSLCDERWTVENFRRVWSGLDRAQLGRLAIKKSFGDPQ